MNAEQSRLEEARTKKAPWKKWGPCQSKCQVKTVREDYSESGRENLEPLPDLRLEFTYEYTLTPNMDVGQYCGRRMGRLSGGYSDFALEVFAPNFGWQF